jgi:hypothetical protein
LWLSIKACLGLACTMGASYPRISGLMGRDYRMQIEKYWTNLSLRRTWS